MLLRIVTAAAFLSVLGGGAIAGVELVDSDFQVTFQYGGVEQRLSETTVPMLPSNVCYTWWLKLGEGAAPGSAIERLLLPEPPASWGDAATDDGMYILEDGKLALSRFYPEIDSDGWISKGWCAAAGDPIGSHRIEVVLDGVMAKAFDFEVVRPEDYPWPALRQPDPRERSVQNSW